MSRPIRSQAAAVEPPIPWRSRILGHEDVAPQALLAHPDNWRRHPVAQQRALRSALSEIGWVQSVVVNRRSDRILDGHARVKEAIARGEPTVPVTWVDLAEDEERLALATFDAIGSLAEADPAALERLLAGVTTDDADLAALLDGLAAAAGLEPTTADPDAVPAAPDPAAVHVRPGQLWHLDGHRLLVGDALDPAAVHRLLGDDRPTLLVTDPPFGVALDLGRRHALERLARARGAGHRRVSLAGDHRAEWAAAYALVQSLEVGYVWHPALRVAEVVRGLEAIGFEPVSEIVWRKTRWAVGRRWYHWQHESCLVVRRRGARTRFLGGRDQGTVWDAPSPKLGGDPSDPKVDHPSQKPVVLFERPVRNHLPPGGLCYDPFAGSGTALIAAERSHRRCLAMEIDPGVAQVAIERWEAFTGRQAELADGEG